MTGRDAGYGDISVTSCPPGCSTRPYCLAVSQGRVTELWPKECGQRGAHHLQAWPPDPALSSGSIQAPGRAQARTHPLLPSWQLGCMPTLPEGHLGPAGANVQTTWKAKRSLYCSSLAHQRVSQDAALSSWAERMQWWSHRGLAWLPTWHWPQSVFLKPGRQSPQNGMRF